MLITQKYFSKYKIFAFLLPATFVSGMAYSANANDFPELLSELDETVLQFAEVDTLGKEIQESRGNNRQEMSRLDSEAAAIASLKSQIDNGVVEYSAALEVFNAQCEGQTLTGAESRNCQTQQQALISMSVSLDEDAADLTPRVDEYNQQIDAFNTQDAALAVEEERVFNLTQEYIAQINSVKRRFDTVASANGDAGMITAVQRCNALQGYKDTVTCLRAVWSLYGD